MEGAICLLNLLLLFSYLVKLLSVILTSFFSCQIKWFEHCILRSALLIQREKLARLWISQVTLFGIYCKFMIQAVHDNHSNNMFSMEYKE